MIIAAKYMNAYPIVVDKDEKTKNCKKYEQLTQSTHVNLKKFMKNTILLIIQEIQHNRIWL